MKIWNSRLRHVKRFISSRFNKLPFNRLPTGRPAATRVHKHKSRHLRWCVRKHKELVRLLTLQEDVPIYIPLVPQPPRKYSLLFVGLNPSFNITAVSKFLPSIQNPESYFAWDNRAKFDAIKDIKLQTEARKNYDYFDRFETLTNNISKNYKKGFIKWDHIDLFFWRETSQKKFRRLILKKYPSGIKLKPAWDEQLKLSIGIIKEANPICIVVANALASDIYKKYEGHNLQFNSSRGYYEQNFNGRIVPVFLSSMLSGGALDKHSLERLEWHIQRSLNDLDRFEEKPTYNPQMESL